MMPPTIMNNSLINFLAVGLYLAAGLWLMYRLTSGQPNTGNGRVVALSLGVAAVILHSFTIYGGNASALGLKLSLTAAFSLVAWSVAVLYLLSSLWRPVDNLGAIVLPVAALTVLVEWLWPGQSPIPLSSRAQAAHIVIAIVAYSLLCLATIQSLMLLAQEKRLRHHHADGIVRALPPMQTMEQIMFQMIALGFLLLTATLISGVFFSESVFGTAFKLTHHVVLAALGWTVYALLLLGRWRFGWRGRTAVRWTLGGFSLLLLAYFGSKFVLEVILQRAA
jgi:ABC-type uncharacterized transport system permease subunit